MTQEFRIEKDSLGEVKVPSKSLWGAQTQRAKQNFGLEHYPMPREIIHSIAIIKKAAAKTNFANGLLDKKIAEEIMLAADMIVKGELNEHFPLSVWQSGSGTQSNMNVNEVIANLCNKSLGEKSVNPNDHVNMCQSSNDTFPTATHIAIAKKTKTFLIPKIQKFTDTLDTLIRKFGSTLKIGRTHMQDAVPMTLGQELSGYRSQMSENQLRIEQSLKSLLELPQGGTAVGTGLNAFKDFDKNIAAEIATLTDIPFVTAKNKFECISSRDRVLALSGAMNCLCASLSKIANDIRTLSSGPKCGIAELILPANEPGSSIMPGKINPTQCESLAMICAHVSGLHAALSAGCASGHLNLNVFAPMIAYNALDSIELLGSGMQNFNDHCLSGIMPNQKKLDYYLENSLMLVTALNKTIGYEKASQIALKAYKENLSLKESALALGISNKKELDELLDPNKMIPELQK